MFYYLNLLAHREPTLVLCKKKSKELNGMNVTDAPQIRGRRVRLRWSTRAALTHVPRQAYARAGDKGQGVGLRS